VRVNYCLADLKYHVDIPLSRRPVYHDPGIRLAWKGVSNRMNTRKMGKIDPLEPLDGCG
jgi:hypothetical protein